MKEYYTFIFDSFSFDPAKGSVELNYSLDDEEKFTETVILPTEGLQDIDKATLDRALFNLHLIGGISYFKTCCPKTIKIRSGSLSKEQADFWNTVYTKGLGEFFYRNKIDFHGLINFPSTDDVSKSPAQTEKESEKILIPIGGGKDSIVTTEMLRKTGADLTLMRMGAHPLIDQVASISGLPMLTVERKLSPRLFEMNEEGALNGHVPITGYLSFLNVLCTLLYGFDAIAISNERSASEGNVEYLGEQINHQWSKSEEFEKMFNEYVPEAKYWSPLRSMTELEIAEQFSKHPEYFPLFTSCNCNWRITEDRPSDKWCKKCPKCAFAFVILSAYLPNETLTEIFDGNLYENESLIPLFKQLLGLEGFKPFECVGTPEETKKAFDLAHERGDLDDTPVMQMYLSSQ